MDPQEIAERLKTLGAKAHCPMCSGTQWASAPVEDPDDAIEFGYGLRAFPLVCAQCGFIRFHALNVVDPEAAPDADMTPPTKPHLH